MIDIKEDPLKVLFHTLENGSWKPIVQEAMDELAAGENNVKWILFYSGLTASQPEKLHVFVMGKSQKGKTFLMKQMGSLFEDDFVDISEMSARSLYYEAKEKKNQSIYKNKIAFLDEFNDRSQDTKNFVKKATTHRQGPLTLKTVSDQKYMECTLDNLPVFWTNSMEKVEDVGDQMMNRFLKVNVLESLEQSKAVERFQIERESIGRSDKNPSFGKAKYVVGQMKLDGPVKILNAFASFVSLNDHSVHNRRPMWNTLLQGITIANRYMRPRIGDIGIILPPSTDHGSTILSALSDNLEALRIYQENERFQSFNLPERYIKFYAIFNEDEWLTDDEMSLEFTRLYGKTDGLSPGSCYQYAHTLENSNRLRSRKRDGSRSKEYSRMPSDDGPTKSHIHVLEFSNFDERMLADTVKAILNSTITNNTNSSGPDLEIVDSIVRVLMDVDLPEKRRELTQNVLMNQEGNE